MMHLLRRPLFRREQPTQLIVGERPPVAPPVERCPVLHGTADVVTDERHPVREDTAVAEPDGDLLPRAFHTWTVPVAADIDAAVGRALTNITGASL